MEAQDVVEIRSDQALCAWSQMTRPDFNFVVCLNSVFCAKNHLITLDQALFVRDHKDQFISALLMGNNLI